MTVELRFMFSGSMVYSTRSDHVPPVGAKFTIKTTEYKKGYEAGTVLTATVSEEDPPVYDFSNPSGLIVYIDVNNFEVYEGVPELDD